MLVYKQGRFYSPGMSFSLPENFVYENLVSDEDEAFLVVRNPLIEDYRVFYKITRVGNTAEKEIQEHIKNDIDVVLKPMALIYINGLHGFQISYEIEGGNQFFEACFDIDLQECGSLVFTLCVEAYNSNVEEIKDSSVFQNILNGIKKERYVI